MTTGAGVRPAHAREADGIEPSAPGRQSEVLIEQAWRRMLIAQRRLLDERKQPRETPKERSTWHLAMAEAHVAHSRFIQLVREGRTTRV